MKVKIETEALFSIPMGYTTIPSEICNVFNTLKGREQTHGRTDIFNVLDEHPKIKSYITDVFTLWVNTIWGLKDQKWAMTTSWVTLNPDGSQMGMHRHFNCAYSGVLYFDKVDATHPPLEFLNPLKCLDGSFLVHTPAEKSNIFNRVGAFAPISEGQMIFFPSYILHSHPSFKPTDIVRKSFACNFFPIGKYGLLDSTVDTRCL